MRIADVKPKADYTLQVTTDDGRTGIFDVRPYLEFEAFTELKKQGKLKRITTANRKGASGRPPRR